MGEDLKKWLDREVGLGIGGAATVLAIPDAGNPWIIGGKIAAIVAIYAIGLQSKNAKQRILATKPGQPVEVIDPDGENGDGV